MLLPQSTQPTVLVLPVIPTAAGNFVNDFREELPFVLSFPQYFKSFNYTTLGHSKL